MSASLEDFESPAEIIPDTHAIRELLKEENSWVIDAIDDICHVLVIPKLHSEFRVHVEQYPMLAVSLKTRLRGKFIANYTPHIRIPEDVERTLKQEGASQNDLIVFKVAYERSQKTRKHGIVVSNDPAFHHASGILQRYSILVVGVNNFLRILKKFASAR